MLPLGGATHVDNIDEPPPKRTRVQKPEVAPKRVPFVSGIVHRYVVAHDLGVAPCVHSDLLSLATCKPKLRKIANVGDIILGYASKLTWGESGRLVFIAVVTQIVSVIEYHSSVAYASRLDNIYKLVDGVLVHKQEIAYHNAGPNKKRESEQKKDKRHKKQNLCPCSP